MLNFVYPRKKAITSVFFSVHDSPTPSVPVATLSFVTSHVMSGVLGSCSARVVHLSQSEPKRKLSLSCCHHGDQLILPTGKQLQSSSSPLVGLENDESIHGVGRISGIVFALVVKGRRGLPGHQVLEAAERP
jgi:hypothetical protein